MLRPTYGSLAALQVPTDNISTVPLNWLGQDGRKRVQPPQVIRDLGLYRCKRLVHVRKQPLETLNRDLAWLCVIRARRRAAGGPRTLGPLSQIPTTFANIEDLLMYHRSVASSGEADHSGNLLLRAVLRRAKVRSTQMRLLLTVHCRMPCRVQSRSACSSMLPTPYG